MDNKPSRTQRPDAQAFDEVKIVTVPRWKESELSGDEWRISALVQLLRKGQVIHEESFHDVDSAARYLPFVIARAIDDGKGYFAGIDNICDQEGCSEEATTTLKLKQEYCDKGHPHPIEFSTKIRKFCDRHKKRGDCGLEDADSNYEEVTA